MTASPRRPDRPAWLAWLRPRRSILPVALFVGVLWTVPLHVVAGRPVFGDVCSGFGACLGRLAWFVPASLLVGGAGTYLLAAAVTAVLERRAGVVAGLPAVFDPPTTVRNAVGVAAALAAATLVAAGYGALWTPLGLAALYALYAPAFWLFFGFTRVVADPTPVVADPTAALVLLVVVAYAQVAWWYLLGHAAVRVPATLWWVRARLTP